MSALLKQGRIIPQREGPAFYVAVWLTLVNVYLYEAAILPRKRLRDYEHFAHFMSPLIVIYCTNNSQTPLNYILSIDLTLRGL